MYSLNLSASLGDLCVSIVLEKLPNVRESTSCPTVLDDTYSHRMEGQNHADHEAGLCLTHGP